MPKLKKFNSSTGCYKIDVFVNGIYFTSTDQSKTCKEAKQTFVKSHPQFKWQSVTAHYFYH